MKILIIRFSSLGDIVLTEPVVRNIRWNFPQAEIHYLTKEVYKELLKHFENIDKIWIWDKNKIDVLKELAKEGFDIVLDLHNKLNSFIAKRYINSKKTITYDKKHLLRKMIVNKLSSSKIDSVVDLYLSTLKKLDFQVKKTAPKLIFIQSNYEIFDRYEIPSNKTLIGIFPGATHNTKRYPTGYLYSFIDSVSNSWNCHFLLMGDYKDKQLAIDILSNTKKNVTDLTGVFSIDNLINFMSELDGFITNDSGPMHIAAALQKPQIAIFGATHPRLGFRPINKSATILVSNTKCQPCSLHGNKSCPKSHYNCMKKISAALLLETFQKVLENDIWQI